MKVCLLVLSFFLLLPHFCAAETMVLQDFSLGVVASPEGNQPHLELRHVVVPLLGWKRTWGTFLKVKDLRVSGHITLYSLEIMDQLALFDFGLDGAGVPSVSCGFISFWGLPGDRFWQNEVKVFTGNYFGVSNALHLPHFFFEGPNVQPVLTGGLELRQRNVWYGDLAVVWSYKQKAGPILPVFPSPLMAKKDLL